MVSPLKPLIYKYPFQDSSERKKKGGGGRGNSPNFLVRHLESYGTRDILELASYGTRDILELESYGTSASCDNPWIAAVK